MHSSIIFTAVIAWLQIVANFAGLIISSYLLYSLDSTISIPGVQVSVSVCFLIALIDCLIGLLAALLLIIGLQKKSTLFAIPWLCNRMICIICYTIAIISSELYSALIVPGIMLGIWLIALKAIGTFKEHRGIENSSQMRIFGGADQLPSYENLNKV